MIRDTQAAPLESVKHVLEKSSVCFAQVTKIIGPDLLQSVKSHQNKCLVTGDGEVFPLTAPGTESPLRPVSQGTKKTPLNLPTSSLLTPRGAATNSLAIKR